MDLASAARARGLLAWLAVHPGTHARSVLAARLRPDVRDDSARKSLRQAAWSLRTALGRRRRRPGRRPRAAGAERRPGPGGGRPGGVPAPARRRRPGGGGRRRRGRAAGGPRRGVGARACARPTGRRWSRCSAAWPTTPTAGGDLARRRRLGAPPGGRRPARRDRRPPPHRPARPRRGPGRARSPPTTPCASGCGGSWGWWRRPRRASWPRRSAAAARRGPPGAAGTAQPPLPPPLVRTGPFVGRAGAAGRVAAAWRDAAAGPRVVMLAGEPGIGKTRLAAHVAAGVHAGGALVLYGRCDEDTLVPHQPFVEALERHLAALPATERDEAIGATRADLARVLPGVAPPGGGPARRRPRHRPLPGVRGGAGRAAGLRGGPAGAAGARRPPLGRPGRRCCCCATSAGCSSRCRCCVLGTYRDTEVDAGHPLAATLGDLRRDHPVVTVTLEGLADDEVADLVRAADGARRRGRRPGGAGAGQPAVRGGAGPRPPRGGRRRGAARAGRRRGGAARRPPRRGRRRRCS